MHTTVRHTALALLSALLLMASLAVTATPAHAAIDSGAEAEFVKLVNGERAKKGLGQLRVASDLVKVARRHSQDMAAQNRLHHNPDLGDDVDNWKRLAENVGRGPSVSSLHKAFMDSPGHRANILDGKVTEIGIGVEVRNGIVWVTEVFRLPTYSTSSSGVPAPLPSGTDVRPLAGDWDGNGTVTPGWFIDGSFYLSNRHDGSGALISFRYGIAGDLPLVGDWNGDGVDTVGIVRDGEWHLINHHKGGRAQISFVYGRVKHGDIPLAGDWDGNGTDTPAIVRDGEWHFINHFRGGRSQFSFVYGRVTRGDIPFVGDWNGDGVDTAGIIRDGEWHLVNSHRGGRADVSFVYGRVSKGDIPVVGDWDGDGDRNIAIVRDDTWHFRLSNAGGTADLSHIWAP
jgi:hypothetical protein